MATDCCELSIVHLDRDILINSDQIPLSDIYYFLSKMELEKSFRVMTHFPTLMPVTFFCVCVHCFRNLLDPVQFAVFVRKGYLE